MSPIAREQEVKVCAVRELNLRIRETFPFTSVKIQLHRIASLYK